MSGYKPNRTKEIVRDDDIEDGDEPFRATISNALTFGDIDSIRLDHSMTFAELFAVIAPFVLKWNALGRNSETGEYEPLPPPAEAGPEILRSVEPRIALWLALQLRVAHRLPDLPKELTPIESTLDGLNDNDSDSAPPETSA